MKVEFKIDKASLSRTISEMTDLSKAASEKEASRILRQSVTPIVDEMERRAPTADNDNILSNIGITTAKKRTKNSGGVRVGVVGKKWRGKQIKFSPQALAGSIEYGTKERQKQSGASTGAIESTPFLRPAWDENVNQVEGRIEKAIDRLVQRRLK